MTASLKILILRFVCEGGREEGEYTVIFWSMRIRFCSLYPPLLQHRENNRSYTVVRGVRGQELEVVALEKSG